MEEKIQSLLGAKDMTICLLQTKLEEAQARIVELEKTLPKKRAKQEQPDMPAVFKKAG